MTLEVKDAQCKTKIENYLMNITRFVHKFFFIMIFLDLAYRGVSYLSEPVFYDRGYALLRGFYSCSYFLFWFGFHYMGFHQVSLYFPHVQMVMVGGCELSHQYYFRHHVTMYEQSGSLGTMFRMLFFSSMLNWSSMKSTATVGAAIQTISIVWITIVTINNDESIPSDEKFTQIRRWVSSFFVTLAGELTLHYVKLKSISDLVIQNVLIERQTLTTTEYLLQSKHAIIVVN